MLISGDVVIVPFPFAEGKGHKWRPAVVISSPEFHEKYKLCWVMMVTSAENPSWPGDIKISSLRKAGLGNPSIIRPAKIATLQVDSVKKIGKISVEISKKLAGFIRNNI